MHEFYAVSRSQSHRILRAVGARHQQGAGLIFELTKFVRVVNLHSEKTLNTNAGEILPGLVLCKLPSTSRSRQMRSAPATLRMSRLEHLFAFAFRAPGRALPFRGMTAYRTARGRRR